MDKILKYAIKEAEDKYGKSRHNRTLLPVQYRLGNPDVTYPSQHELRVTISSNCHNEVFRAYYQLAHEAIHTLNPVSIQFVSWLEEGVAVNYSHDFLNRHCGIKWKSSGDKKYDQAWMLVQQLLSHYPNAIRKIMNQFGRLSDLNYRDVHKLFPNASITLIEALCGQFNPQA